MRPPHRFAPPTELDALRALLNGYAEGDRTFEGQFTRLLQSLRQLALTELGQRLCRNSTPRGLRRLILAACAQNDWPSWDQHLLHMLHSEEDLGLFEEGCDCLGALCTPKALEGLRHLKASRRDPLRQEILDRELGAYEPDHGADVYISAMHEGTRSPALARQAARCLAVLAGPEHFAELLEAIRIGDALTQHLALRVLAFVPDPLANDLLLSLFQESRLHLEANRRLISLEPELKGITRTALRERIVLELQGTLITRVPDLQRTLPTGEGATPDMETLKAVAQGPLEGFLVEALDHLVNGRSATLQKHLSDVVAAAPQHIQELGHRLDELAVLLAAQTEAGAIPLDDLLPVLEAAFLAHEGGDDVLVAYLCLVPVEDRARLDRVLALQDMERKKRSLEILGAREEDHLVPFFMLAMQDPNREIQQLAVRQFGKLPSGFPVMMDFFRSGKSDKIRQAIHFFDVNHAAAAAKPLLSFIASDAQDDLQVDAVHALGSIRDPNTVNGLLAQLHSGKPLLFQLALVEALTHIGTPAASLGLLKKSEGLTLPEVLMPSLKGALAAFPGFDQPFPAEHLPALEHLVKRCSDAREGGGQWMAAAQTVQELYTFNHDAYARLQEHFSAFVEEGHLHHSREAEIAERLMELLKQMAKRAENLLGIQEREKGIQVLIDAYPHGGPGQLEALGRFKEAFSDPDLILSLPFGQLLAAFLRRELKAPHQDWHELERLCEVAGLSGQDALVEDLRDIYLHTTSVGIRSAARKALQNLGLNEQEIERRSPPKSVLILEPNAFFRKRLLSVLENPGRTVSSASGRNDAEQLLGSAPVDLLITECSDATGHLAEWIIQGWEAHRFRYVLLSTAEHDVGALAGKPWVIGRLYKPYPMEELTRLIEG